MTILARLNAAAGQPLADEIELVERAVADRHGARARVGIGIDPHREPEKFLQMALNRRDIRRLARIARGPGVATLLNLNAMSAACGVPIG